MVLTRYVSSCIALLGVVVCLICILVGNQTFQMQMAACLVLLQFLFAILFVLMWCFGLQWVVCMHELAGSSGFSNLICFVIFYV